ncbi:S53 family peptidase [Streptantibioticus silvisoli]|uniref:S53 family peptidase n=1 Tax=Streptantibioticus silvisoli TaxID=2705255 RepID=A0ABT6VX32_9ACTN|nr:S53 family peptidase [Streptantibioticus silvisoli]MDI5961821.1 S53 family peptidase [Streptantibioticus silvisoli]
MRRARPRTRAAAAAAVLAAAALTGAVPPGAAAVPAAATPAVKVVPAIAGHHLVRHVDSPVSIEQCQAKWKINCYTPLQYRKAYDLDALYDSGVTGEGRTIVIVDSFGSPTIQHDLDTYSKQFGMPSTRVRVVKWGHVPAFDLGDADMTGWAGETTLDVEMAHAVAPGASIVLVETGVAETEGVTGLPEMMSAEKSLIDRGTGDVISQSFGATENTFPGFAKGDHTSIMRLRYAFEDAAAHDVTVLGSSGDGGATDDTDSGAGTYAYPVNSFPSADPLVTSIGGTQLHLNDQGRRLAPDSVYNDFGAGGGGPSHVFTRPSYQDGVRGIVGAWRGTPDVSMSAAVDGGAWVYASFDPASTGWDVYGGTSESCPLFAGVVALADQAAGHRVGDIHRALYALRDKSPYYSGVVDIDDGTDNGYGTVPGYRAVAGYDLASGVGTVDAAKFVPALAAESWKRH